MSKRIGIDIQCLTRPLTGVGYYTLGLLKGLAALEPPERIVPFYFSRTGDIDLPAEVYARLPPRQKRIPPRLLAAAWKTLRFPPLDRLVGGMDLYHFPDFVARPVSSHPVVTTVYDLAFRRHPEFVEPANLAFLKKHLDWSLRRSRAIITISEFSRRELLGFYPIQENRVRVVPGGVDESFRRRASPEELSELRYRLNLPERYLLTVGTWEPRKNLSGLLKAWKILRDSGRTGDRRLVLAGMKGWLCGELEENFRDLGSSRGLIAAGYVRRADLSALYQGAELFVFPSFYEGQGFPPLEAQAAGTAVAAASAGALLENLGESAAFFDPASPEEMAETIGTLLEDGPRREELARRGRENSRRFTWEESARRTLAVYRELL